MALSIISLTFSSVAIPLKDQAQRIQALNTQRSFIVQAPAGSGKTELLVQRYVALLIESNTPEAVLALTFTRKAAFEMKQRVLDILAFGQTDTPVFHEAYQQARWELGRKLYQWQVQKQWHLLENSERLQIQTIDAFYAQLTRKVPLQSGLTPTTKILEDPTSIYQTAVQQLFLELEQDSTLGHALARLCQHLNNDFIQVERLLVHMLGCRDQWVSVVPQDIHSLQPLRASLEDCLQKLCERTYQSAEQAFSHCGIDNWDQKLQSLILLTSDSTQADLKPELTPRQFWNATADLFLTRQNQWRRSISNKNIQNYSISYQKSIKKDLKKWLATLCKQEAIRLALLEVRQLPPLSYTDSQWGLLQDLFHILRALLSILDVLFQQHQQVDYIAVALKASHLLGEENPTELLLNLDYQIQHILIDEFQDTSLQQIRFLMRLTEGWQPKDGRTLFLVGDPMQSIYRFRKADARLFSFVKTFGVGTCELEYIALSTNFRATSDLVQWVNRCFKKMVSRLPSKGAPTSLLQPSVAAKQNACDDTHQAIQTHWLSNGTPEQEADQIIQLVQKSLQNYPESSIAILARARQHLLPVLEKLRTTDIPYQAIDIETLADQPIIQDLLALTRAVTHLADDVAWLALLRAPWCGLYLADLHQLMQACQKKQPSRLIWEQLQQLDDLTLHEDSKLRLNHFIDALRPIVESYDRIPLRERIMQAWYRLGGPATQPLYTWHLEDVECFLQCVDELQVGETLIDSRALEAKLQKTYASPSKKPGTTNKVTLMTIHKAKGLEFDIVILSSLHKSTRVQNHSLILFDELPTLGSPHLLLAPIKASDTTEPDPIYRYLRQMDHQHYQAEVIRLLYVACTRAKKTLHLLGSLKLKDAQEPLFPNIGTFLYWLWPTLETSEKKLVENLTNRSQNLGIRRKLKRMTLNFKAFTEDTSTDR